MYIDIVRVCVAINKKKFCAFSTHAILQTSECVFSWLQIRTSQFVTTMSRLDSWSGVGDSSFRHFTLRFLV